MLIALVAVVAAVALAVLGEGGPLRDAGTDRLDDRLPADRPLIRSDIDAVRLPTAVRGYRMLDVDEVLDRLGAELAERDARIAELESSLAGVHANGSTMSLTKQEEPPGTSFDDPGHGSAGGAGE
ncbi:DivIVA domain-containing protein [Actinacidiphila paucisporea]|uniref:DivIVA domain-containing protein n=2 Tax=Actinacidiphila paucisporea TaxID=310782 RepID=A0A1M6UT85_9ACTN|nr:DivIVA domain-containing protein [Actinacidiphila paucisporea]